MQGGHREQRHTTWLGKDTNSDYEELSSPSTPHCVICYFLVNIFKEAKEICTDRATVFLRVQLLEQVKKIYHLQKLTVNSTFFEMQQIRINPLSKL